MIKKSKGFTKYQYSNFQITHMLFVASSSIWEWSNEVLVNISSEETYWVNMAD